MKFTKYDSEGRVLFVGDAPESMIELQGDDVVIGEVDGRTHYVRAGVAVPRPLNPATFGNRQLNYLPVPCEIEINGKSYRCTEPSATLEFTYPGRYSVIVRAFPYLDANFEVST